jgi:D-beta-D-heptose 7-phosphate kinase/D-beta-D-heptose 1-phosphate adenosyltransferase
MNTASPGPPELERTQGLFDERMRDAAGLVVGDLMLDRYLFGTPGRVSQEAPVLILRHQRQSENPGGAGNVACNLAGLGVTVRLAGVVGEDANGAQLMELLHAAGVNTDAVHSLATRPTTTKCRVTSGLHQLLRIDFEKSGDLPFEVAQMLIEGMAEQTRSEPKAILLSDYAKGVVTSQVAQAAIGLGKLLGIPVLVDPKGADWTKYRGATMATPNRLELAEAAGVSFQDLDGLLAGGETLRRRLNLDFLAVTLGNKE